MRDRFWRRSGMNSFVRRRELVPTFLLTSEDDSQSFCSFRHALEATKIGARANKITTEVIIKGHENWIESSIDHPSIWYATHIFRANNMTGTVINSKTQSSLSVRSRLPRLFASRLNPQIHNIVSLFFPMVLHKRQNLSNVFLLLNTHNFLCVKWCGRSLSELAKNVPSIRWFINAVMSELNQVASKIGNQHLTYPQTGRLRVRFRCYEDEAVNSFRMNRWQSGTCHWWTPRW